MQTIVKVLIAILLFNPYTILSLKADESFTWEFDGEIYDSYSDMQNILEDDVCDLNLFTESDQKNNKINKADVILVSKEETNIFAVTITLVPENEDTSESVHTFIEGTATAVFRNLTTKASQVAKVRDFKLTPSDPKETILVGYPFQIAGNYETLVGLKIMTSGRIKEIEEKVFLNGKEIASAKLSAESQVSRYRFKIK